MDTVDLVIFFALTRSGYENLERHLGTHTGITLWVNKDILTDAELLEIRAAGLSITNFTAVIDGNDDTAVNDAVDTIKQHHPKECVWVER